MCLSALYTKIADTISSASFRGGCEIRTHGTLVTFSGFQDQCIKPLCQISKVDLINRS